MVLALALLPAAYADTDCSGPTPEQAAIVHDVAKDQFRVAQSRVNDTEWQYRLAIEDRDTVLADRDDALADLKDARGTLRDAKRDTKAAEERLARCGPAAPSAS